MVMDLHHFSDNPDYNRIILNIIGWIYHWDPYPFILLNLLFSGLAAYAAPVL